MFIAQRPDGSRCAIKILLGDLTQATRRERFLREAQVGRELTHPGVVQILGAVKTEVWPSWSWSSSKTACPSTNT